MAVNKKINEYRDDDMLKVKTYMDDGQSEKRCVPDQQTATHYYKRDQCMVMNTKYVIHITKQEE